MVSLSSFDVRELLRFVQRFAHIGVALGLLVKLRQREVRLAVAIALRQARATPRRPRRPCPESARIVARSTLNERSSGNFFIAASASFNAVA